MGPRWTIDELLQKQRSADCAAPPPARIFHVRPFAADQILVIVPDGQAPQALTSSLATFNQLPSQLIVIREQSRRFAGQCDHARAGERGVIDQMIGLELRCIMQRVAEDHSPFGVGVDDLHGLAIHHRDDVARLVCAAARQIVRRRNGAGDLHSQIELRRRFDGADDRRRSAHVEFHLLHSFRGLDGDAAGIEGDAFADQRDMLLCLLRRVLHDHEARLFVRAAIDGDEAAHPHPLLPRHRGPYPPGLGTKPTSQDSDGRREAEPSVDTAPVSTDGDIEVVRGQLPQPDQPGDTRHPAP